MLFLYQRIIKSFVKHILVTSQRRKTTNVEALSTVFMCKNVVLNTEPRIVRAHLENGLEKSQFYHLLNGTGKRNTTGHV